MNTLENPTKYRETWSLQGDTLFFLISAQKHWLWVSTIYVWSNIQENIAEYKLKMAFLQQSWNLELYCIDILS